MLVRAKIKKYPNPPKSTTPITINRTKPGKGNSMPCKVPGCECCTSISTKCRVTSTFNNKTYPTQTYTNCSTRNIIYLIECTKCTKGNQFIGLSTEPLRTKLAKHKTESTNKTNSPLYKHFLQRPDHNFVRDTQITILQATTRMRLLETGKKWIDLMDTIHPKGLNNNPPHH